MIEKPDIPDERIIGALNTSYSIQTSEIEFLPIGNDATAFSYRVETRDGNSYFLKLKTKLSGVEGGRFRRAISSGAPANMLSVVHTRTDWFLSISPKLAATNVPSGEMSRSNGVWPYSNVKTWLNPAYGVGIRLIVAKPF